MTDGASHVPPDASGPSSEPSASASPVIVLDPIASKNVRRSLPSRIRLITRIARAIDRIDDAPPRDERLGSLVWGDGSQDVLRAHLPRGAGGGIQTTRVMIEIDPHAAEPAWIDVSGNFSRQTRERLPGDHPDVHLPDLAALRDLARHLRRLAAALDGGPSLASDEWSLAVRSIVSGHLLPEDEGGVVRGGRSGIDLAVPMLVHVASSPLGDEVLARLIFDVSGDGGGNGGGIHEKAAPPPGLPAAMSARIVGRRMIVSLSGISTIVTRIAPEESMRALRAVGELSRLTGWTPNAGGK
jgi:hypothetical protein